jgi:hypothetical protein
MQIQHTDEIKINGIKILVYGQAKLGKTRLSATAPSPFIFSAENGLLSLRRERVAFTTITTLKDIDEAYQWMTTSKEARCYQTFCLDSISEIAEIVLANELGKTKDPRAAYGEMAKTVFARFRKFRDFAGPNVYFIAKEEYDKDTLNGGMIYLPSFPGKQLGMAAPYFYDIVARLASIRAQDGNYYTALQCKADTSVTAGDRSGSLNIIEEPHLGNLFAKILAT